MFGEQKLLTLEIDPCDFLKLFLKIWQFDPHFLINYFLIKKPVLTSSREFYATLVTEDTLRNTELDLTHR